jgi:hypothetical protein
MSAQTATNKINTTPFHKSLDILLASLNIINISKDMESTRRDYTQDNASLRTVKESTSMAERWL